MAKIQFLPVCSHCGSVIADAIEYYYDSPGAGRIYPYRCAQCGEVFCAIEMPTKLPFDNSHYNEVNITRRNTYE